MAEESAEDRELAEWLVMQHERPVMSGPNGRIRVTMDIANPYGTPDEMAESASSWRDVEFDWDGYQTVTVRVEVNGVGKPEAREVRITDLDQPVRLVALPLDRLVAAALDIATRQPDPEIASR